jgi:hypothetical protein
MKKELIILSMLIVFITVAKVALADSDFKVTGIMDDGRNPVAIVDGQIVQEGSEVGGAEVEKINNDSVAFKYQNQIIIKSLGAVQEKNIQSQSLYDYKVREINDSIEDKKIQQSIDAEYLRRQEIDEKWESKRRFDLKMNHDEEMEKLKHADELELIQKARLWGGVAPEVKVEEDD